MKKIIVSVLILSLFFLNSSCNKKDNNPVDSGNGDTGKIQTGEVVQIATQTIGTAGGTITVNKPGDALNGLKLTVPVNGFTEPKSFNISYRPITKHSMGEYFNPISPLIKISYEGGYSDQPMQVKVPISLPAGHFAMGFFYDEETGKVEGLPIDALDSTSITVSTRHFSQPSSLSKRSGIRDFTSWGDLVISSVKEQILTGQSIISSGFTPGVDDWEFINLRSYINSVGICAGMSMTAMWYYYEKTLKGEPRLYHLFDQLNNSALPKFLWQDNPKGIRFASTIQEDIDWTLWSQKVDVQTWFPELTWKAFALAMLVTGDPQFVIIRKSTPPRGAHAMIMYKINFSEGKLYIADPNYPNNRDPFNGVESIRTIDYANGQFTPYPSSLTAGSSLITYDRIAYFGKTANINWSQITNRWVEFQNGTIGNDRFPVYTLWLEDGSGRELNDGLDTDADTLIFHCKMPACPFWWGDHFQDVEVYDDQGNLISSNNKGKISVVLKGGQNKLGLYMEGTGSDRSNYYVDFKWINVYKDTTAKKIAIPSTNITNDRCHPGYMEPSYNVSGTIQGKGLTSTLNLTGDNSVDMYMDLLESALPVGVKFDVKIQNISMRFIYGDGATVPLTGTYWNTPSRALGEYKEYYKVRIKGYDWTYTKMDATGSPEVTYRTTEPKFTLTIDKINYSDPSTISHSDQLDMYQIWEVTTIQENWDGTIRSTTTIEVSMKVLVASFLKK